MFAAIAIACCLAGLAEAGAASPAEPPTREAAKIQGLVIDAPDVEIAALEDELALRLHGRQLVRAPEKPELPLYGYLEVRRRDDGALVVRLILSDGRGYLDEVPAADEQEVRTLAQKTANLVLGIEGDNRPPDITDAEMPKPPVLEKKEDPFPPDPIPEPKPVEPRYELGLSLGGVVITGLGPPGNEGAAAGAGDVTFNIRGKRGAVLEIGVRPGGRTKSAQSQDGTFAIVRVRTAFGAGYGLRTKKGFEMLTTASFTVEPWLVRFGGSREPLLGGSVGERTSFLLGAAIKVSPGYRRQFKGRRFAFRIAPRIELAGSAIPTADGGVARVGTGPPADPDPGGADEPSPFAETLFRAGGLELNVGLDIGLWFWGPHSVRRGQ